MNPIAIRLLNQQLFAPQYANPTEVVAHMGAIQAQDYRMMRWAVALRTKHPTAKKFEKAYNKGEIIRLHLLRGTWQLIAAKDYGWMHALCAPMAEKAIRGWMKTNKVEISKVELQKVRKLFEKTCEKEGSATKEELARSVREGGMVMDNQRLSYHIRLGELNGTLCSGKLTERFATYALAATRVKQGDIPTHEVMLRRLAEKYFKSHSPATIEDFQWWSGLNGADCRRAMEELGEELDEIKNQQYSFYLHKKCRLNGYRRGSTLLLPPFDEWLIGYKSRELVIKPENMGKAYTKNGIFFPVIAYNGHIVGKWKPWGKTEETVDFEGNKREWCTEKGWKEFQSYWNPGKLSCSI